MSEQQISNQEVDDVVTNVVAFQPVKDRNREPQPTDEEIAEYRRIRPLLLKMIEEWPKLMQHQQAIGSNCMLARKILSGDP